MDAVGAQRRDVPPRRGLRPHRRVHRRREQHRRAVSQQDRGGEIVGTAGRHPRHQVGGRRRHDDHIGFARQADVADVVLVVAIEQIGEDRAAGERADRQRRDEFLRASVITARTVAPRSRSRRMRSSAL